MRQCKGDQVTWALYEVIGRYPGQATIPGNCNSLFCQLPADQFLITAGKNMAVGIGRMGPADTITPS